MNIKFGFHLIVCVLVIHCIEGKTKERCREQSDDKGKGPNAQQSDVRPQYINRFSESLKFLGSFFQVIQRQLSDTITNFNPNRPNPLFSMVLANPSLIPFALRRLRDPLTEMVSITTKIEDILSTNDTKQLENNSELNKLLQQLNRRLHTLFGPLVPHNNLLTRLPPIGATFPEMLESVSGWVSQVAGMLAIFSQSVRDVTNAGSNTRPTQWTLNNRSDVEIQSQTDIICSQLKDLDLGLIDRQNNGGILGALTALLPAVVTALTTVLSSTVTGVGGILGNVGSVVGVGGGIYGNPGTFRNSTIVIPLNNKTVDEYQEFIFGVIDSQNKLIITNILIKDNVTIDNFNQDNNNNQSLISRMSLNSLNSLMISIANDLNTISEPKFMSALKCQLESFDCSLRNRDNYPEVQTCLRGLSACIGTVAQI